VESPAEGAGVDSLDKLRTTPGLRVGAHSINYLVTLPIGKYFEDLQEELDYAHRVVRITQGNYLHGNEAVVKFLFGKTRESGNENGTTLPEKPTHPVLIDFIAYKEFANRARLEDAEAKRAAWLGFIEDSPNNHFRAEAEFNAISALMNTSADLDVSDHVLRKKGQALSGLVKNKSNGVVTA
jgi:hypothetical protein